MSEDHKKYNRSVENKSFVRRLGEELKDGSVKYIAALLIGALGTVVGLVGGWLSSPKMGEMLGVMPIGAVIAFDQKDGCPSGWTDLGKQDPERFAGRGIIAVGPHVERNEGKTTRARALHDEGGEEMHRLTESEMPTHYHSIGSLIKDKFIPDNIDVLTIGTPSSKSPEQIRRTGATGGDQYHNNMQPFIALYLCKKQ